MRDGSTGYLGQITTKLRVSIGVNCTTDNKFGESPKGRFFLSFIFIYSLQDMVGQSLHKAQTCVNIMFQEKVTVQYSRLG